MDWFETNIRVRYAETDKMGIVHHSNYLIWFEVVRSEFCRSQGFSYQEMERDNALLIVAESYCRYKSPAFYDDLLTIRTAISDIKSRSIKFAYEIIRADDKTLVATGETHHVVTDHDKKVRIIPKNYRELLLAKSKSV